MSLRTLLRTPFALPSHTPNTPGRYESGRCEDTGPGSSGPEVSQTASYTWKRSGDVLTLEAKQDECADRDSILSGDWRRR